MRPFLAFPFTVCYTWEDKFFSKGYINLDMNIMHLRYALAIEETGSVTRAAERLFVAQPNISRAIKELENSVGLELFRRTPLGMVATEEGKPFLNRARHIVKEIDGLKSTYENGKNTHGYFSDCSHGARAYATAFAKFVAAQTEDTFSYSFAETGSADAVFQVAQGMCGLGIIRFYLGEEAAVEKYVSSHGLEMRPLFTAPLFYTISEKCPLSKVAAISQKDAARLTEITNPAVLSLEAENTPGARRIRLWDRESRIQTLNTRWDTFFWSTKEEESFLKANGLEQKPPASRPGFIMDAAVFRKKYTPSRLDKAFLEYVEKQIDIYK